jgi:hypothetical protein
VGHTVNTPQRWPAHAGARFDEGIGMWFERRAWNAEAHWLRTSLLAAQGGARREYAEVLEWVAARARARFDAPERGEEAVQAALHLLHQLRHTYRPDSCPLHWIDAVLAAAEAGRGHALAGVRAAPRPAWS